MNILLRADASSQIGAGHVMRCLALARSNWQSFCVRLPVHCDQRQLMQALLAAGIATRRGVMCAHREPAYAREPWSCGQGPGPCGLYGWRLPAVA